MAPWLESIEFPLIFALLTAACPAYIKVIVLMLGYIHIVEIYNVIVTADQVAQYGATMVKSGRALLPL